MKNFTSFSENLKNIEERLKNIETFPDHDPDALNNSCSKCDGYGHIIDEKGARPCDCVRKEIAQREIADARIPKHFNHATLDNYDAHRPNLKNCLHIARDFVDHYAFDNFKGLYLTGPTGVGKTHLAVGILKALIERGYDGVFYNVVDLLDNIRATFDPKSPIEAKNRLFHDFERQIFILDDFGVQKTSTWVTDRLYALINRRYQDCKTILITSNISLNDLLLRVDNALSSRIIDMCEEIEIKADDYRRRRSIRTHNSQIKRRSHRI